MTIRIFGAGFSGLTLAYLLLKKGIQVEVFETKGRVGGLLTTETRRGVFSEGAANGILLSPGIEEMCRDLNVPLIHAQKESRKRFIYRRALKRWPLSLSESIRLAFSFLYHRLKGTHRPIEYETVAHWGRRVLGIAATNYLLAPGLQGIYAGDIEKMSAHLVLGRFFTPNRRRPGGLVSPQAGMQSLTEALRTYIESKGGKLFLNQAGIDSNVSTIRAYSARDFKAEACPQLELLSLVKVTVRFSNTSPLNGFGALFPRDAGVRALGVLSNEHIFGRKEEENTESWIFGGATDSEILSLSDDELIQQLIKDREQVFGIAEVPRESSIHRWFETLPHYTVELEKFLEEFDSVQFTGNYLGDLGLGRIFERNEKLAEAWSRNG